MRKFITKILSVITALSCVFALVVPERAYAYESYSRNEVSSAWSAGYAFLAERYPEIPYDSDFDNGNFGGLPGAADFLSTIVTAPSSPFMLWVHNYVYYWFSEWRVQTYDDLPDGSDAQQRLSDQQLNAADFIIREWNIWKEKYPGAAGPTAPDTGDGLFIIWADSISNDLVFSNGVTITVSDAFVNAYNASSSSGSRVAIGVGSSTSGQPVNRGRIFSVTRYSWETADISIALAPVVDQMGFYGLTTKKNAATSSLSKFTSLSATSISYDSSLSLTSNSSLVSGWFTDTGHSAFGDPPCYVVTNGPIYYDGDFIDFVGPSPEGPVGPTAPDYPSPETPVINNPVSPTIPLTFTDTGNTYTGNETDYSDYLQIIIDNQNTQIDQLKALSNGIVQIWDNYMGWLDSEFDAVYQWFEHFNANWNTLFEWLHTIAEDLFSIDQTFTSFRNEVTDYLERIVTVLYRIFDKIALRYSPDNPNPSVNIEPGSGLDISDPLMTWIKGIIDNILAAISAGIAGLIGTATSSIGNLSNLFPFSLLFDLSLMLGLLNHEPVAPVFDIPYPFSANQNAVLVHVDLSPWTPVMESLRPMWVLLFALGLVYLSVDMIMALYNFLSPGGDN